MISSVSDTTRWKQFAATINIASSFSSIRIAYIDCAPPQATPQKGTILLIHGFPQNSYQFRHVITPLANAGYRTIAPDYRGAGASSKPTSGFTKTAMAQDIIELLNQLGVVKPIHVVGHDIGAMIAYALASRYPDRVASVTWGEAPLPGTSAYEAYRQFHFSFHSVLDLPEALVMGRERIYLNHFFSQYAYNTAAISAADLDHYAHMYSQPGAMRCAFEVYRAFKTDAEENLRWIAENGKCKVPVMALSGEKGLHGPNATKMFGEVHEIESLNVVVLEESYHYLAEENPKGFVREVLGFVEKHPSDPMPM